MALSDFQQLRKIGAGGQGEVFEVLHRPTGRRLALKVFREGVGSAADEPAESRWAPHTRILDPIASGLTDAGLSWQCFPLLNLTSGRATVEADGPAAALTLLTQAAAGMAHIHRAGFVIADLKPDNLLVESTGSPDPWKRWSLYLADLDLARPDADKGSPLSGTRGYLAPELLSGAASQSSATDVFALGSWLVWLISGREPFAGELNGERLVDLVNEELATSPSRADARFKGAVWGYVLSRMLDPIPETRIQDGSELIHFLATQASNDSSWSPEFPRLAMNRLALSPADEWLLRSAQARLHGGSDVDFLVLRYDRPDFVEEMTARLATASNWPMPVLVTPQDEGENVLNRIAAAPESPIVCDLMLADGSNEPEKIDRVLELASLAGQARHTRNFPIVIIAHVADTASKLNSERLGSSSISLVPPVQELADVREWLSAKFSSLAPGLLERLDRPGGLEPGCVDRVLRAAEDHGALRVTSGQISLSEDMAEQLIASAIAARSLSAVSSTVEAVRCIASTMPEGMPTDWLPPDQLQALIDAAPALEMTGGVRLVRVAGVVTSILGVGRGPFDAEPDLLGAVRKLAQEVIERRVNEMDRQSDSLAGLEFLCANEGDRAHRRGRAHVRLLMRTGSYAEAANLLELRRSLHPSRDFRITDILDRLVEANAMLRSGRLEQARRLYESAHDGSDGAYPGWLAARARLNWAVLEFEHGNRALAARLLRECEDRLFRDNCRVPRQLAAATSLLALRLRISDLSDSTLQVHFDRIAGDPTSGMRIKAVALSKWGRRRFAEGDASSARSCFAEALRLARASQDSETIASVLTSVMAYHFARGYLGRTARLLNRMSALPQSELSIADRTAWMSGMGALAYEQGLVRKSYDVNIYLYELSKRLGHEVLKGSATLNLGLLLNLMNHPAASRRYLMESARIGRAAGVRSWEMALIHLGDVELDLGRLDAVSDVLNQLDSGREAEPLDLTRANALRLRGRLEVARGEVEIGLGQLKEASRLFEHLKAADEVLITDHAIVSVALATHTLNQADLAVRALQEKGVKLKNWRLSAMVALLMIRAGVDVGESTDEKLKELIREALDRGFVRLELEALCLLCERQIASGWLAEAADSLRSATDRVRLAANEFTEAELRRDYLAAPGRRLLKDLAEKLK
jgi:serine/threonine protein kinase/tetratricopeptide (TPR) repeat protein